MSYKLRYLPLAKEDLIDIVDYIQVIDDVMEVRRILYSGRNEKKFL